MIHQILKDVYFLVNKWVTLPNTWLTILRFRKTEELSLHLGCGDHYIEGIVNIDGNLFRKKDLWLDLRNPLPFRSASVRLIYCCHTLEHLYPDEALTLLKEMHRVLADDGIVRLAVPSFEHCMEITSGRDVSSWPRQFDDSRSQAINYLFCDGQHKYAYCFENLSSFCQQVGFGSIYDYSRERGVEQENYFGITLGDEPKGSLIVELLKADSKKNRPADNFIQSR